MKWPETELQEIWWEFPYSGHSYTVGTSADRIVLVQDGYGLSGMYDRIHVYSGDKHMIFPAHNVHGWLAKVEG